MTVLAIQHIVETPDICGGKPRIDGTRMRVADVAIYHHSGMSVDEMCEQFDLTPGQVHAALAYYYDNRDMIDQQIMDADAFAKQYLADGHAKTSKELIEQVKARTAK
jgi:uncharacterized protein (DUF433 family)